MERLGIGKKRSGEFSIAEWEALKNHLSKTSDINRQKFSDAIKVSGAAGGAGKVSGAIGEAADDGGDAATNIGIDAKPDRSRRQTKIADIDTATMRARLVAAKQEYDYNKMLITTFQGEAAAYYKSQGTTTMMSHNGSMVSIPSIVNLEKYVKLNIAVSKLISDLEGDLDIGDIDDEDPFG